VAKDLLWKLGDEYRSAPLDPADCDPDPIVEFRRWMKAAVDGKLSQANAMTLATVDERGRPAARIVLLKEVDDRGFVFYTNYDSRKGRDLDAHGVAALVFFWEPMHRQIRVEGSVERVSAAESDAYFASRAHGSQIGAIASPQSQPLPSRQALDDRVAEVSAKYGAGGGPRAARGGGVRGLGAIL
jgi:pyridoxamine 5'-phosphate oxidase